MELQQVMGPSAVGEVHKLAPKFLFNGENPGQFKREFPFAAEYYGVSEAFKWPEGKELSEKEQRLNVMALAILRSYITEDVLHVIMVGEEDRASTLMRALETIFLANDARTKLQVQRELLGCDMRVGESLMTFLGRINKLIHELKCMG